MTAVRHPHVLLLMGMMVLALLVWTTGTSAQQAARGELIFADDLHDQIIGEAPSGWRVNANFITVVEDSSAVRGKAIQLLGDPERASTFSIQVNADAPALVIEHALRWEKNTGLNYYLDSTDVAGGQHNVNWYVGEGGHIGYRYTNEEGRTVTANAGNLKEGWNHLRIVAHAARNEVHIYLNELDQPALGPLPFRTAIEHWEGANLIFYDTGRRDDLTESYYDDFKVWRVIE